MTGRRRSRSAPAAIPTLDPENADTCTFGVVYQPGWLPGFSTSVDYWDIDITGAIGTLGFQRIVDDCFAGAQAMCAADHARPDDRPSHRR